MIYIVINLKKFTRFSSETLKTWILRQTDSDDFDPLVSRRSETEILTSLHLYHPHVFNKFHISRYQQVCNFVWSIVSSLPFADQELLGSLQQNCLWIITQYECFILWCVVKEGQNSQ